MMGALGDMKGVPTWAYSGTTINTNYLGEFVRTLVSRYKDDIHVWETDNEPYATWSGNTFTSAQVANMMTVEVAAIKASDPTAIIIAGGGYDSTNNLGQVWNLLDSTTKSNIYGISCHLYSLPQDNNDTDFDPRPEQFQRFAAGIGKVVWNSESGIWSVGNKHNAGGWLSSGTHIYPWWYEEFYTRTAFVAPSTLTRMALRNIGRGIPVYWYDQRATDRGWQRPDTQPYSYDQDDALVPGAAGMLWIANIVGRGTPVGPVTNTAATTNIEAYVFLGNAGQTVLATWPRVMHTNFIVTLPATNFAVFDNYGLQIQTNVGAVTLGRNPVYIVSTTLGTNAMATNYAGASVTSVADTTAPVVSLDIVETGNVTEGKLPLFWRWTAVDSRWVNTVKYQNSVITRWRIDGLTDWSDWSMRRRNSLDALPAPGIYSFTVEAKDLFGVATNRVTSRQFWVGRSGIGVAGTITAGNANN